MVISVIKGRDILRKEPHESVGAFKTKVLQYKNGADMSAKDFCSMVSVEGLTVSETVTLYADIQRTEGSNVILFQKKRKGESRFPLWEGGAAS